MKRLLSLIIAATFLLYLPANGQCPPAKASGYHVVQKGETLYSISRKYKVPVQNLLQWNGMSMNDVLFVCRELRVSASPGAATGTQAGTPAGTSSASPQQTATHTVRAGEKVADIAKAYGWAEWRFRKMNNLTTWQEVSQGTVLKTNDCACPPLGYAESPQVYDSQQAAIITNGSNERAEETVMEEKKEELKAATGSSTVQPTAPRMAAPFMMPAEIAMAEEINLLRISPAGYIPFIEQHKEEIRAGRAYGSIETCDELINELKNTLPLNLLEPLACLYNAAKKHGEDQRPKGVISHVGTDGYWPWDRVKLACPSLTDGNENLVGGVADARQAVITLLLDEAIPTRGHRRILLSPEWRYVAVYYLGQVGTMPHNWIQLFGK